MLWRRHPCRVWTERPPPTTHARQPVGSTTRGGDNLWDTRAVHTSLLSRLTPVLAILGLALAGGLALPIAGYVAGKRLIGAYEGKLGLTDYLNSVYGAAGRGELLAWWLLLTPALIAIVWYLIIRAGRRSERAPSED